MASVLLLKWLQLKGRTTKNNMQVVNNMVEIIKKFCIVFEVVNTFVLLVML